MLTESARNLAHVDNRASELRISRIRETCDHMNGVIFQMECLHGLKVCEPVQLPYIGRHSVFCITDYATTIIRTRVKQNLHFFIAQNADPRIVAMGWCQKAVDWKSTAGVVADLAVTSITCVFAAARQRQLLVTSRTLRLGHCVLLLFEVFHIAMELSVQAQLYKMFVRG